MTVKTYWEKTGNEVSHVDGMELDGTRRTVPGDLTETEGGCVWNDVVGV